MISPEFGTDEAYSSGFPCLILQTEVLYTDFFLERPCCSGMDDY